MECGYQFKFLEDYSEIVFCLNNQPPSNRMVFERTSLRHVLEMRAKSFTGSVMYPCNPPKLVEQKKGTSNRFKIRRLKSSIRPLMLSLIKILKISQITSFGSWSNEPILEDCLKLSYCFSFEQPTTFKMNSFRLNKSNFRLNKSKTLFWNQGQIGC